MFEKIKENWKEKIEINAVKSDLTYINKEGLKLLKNGVKQEDLPESVKVTERVYIKKSLAPLGDWNRIYPPIDEEGKLNLVNLLFGGKKNLIRLLIILGIVALVFFQFHNNFQQIDKLQELVKICNIRI